MGGHERVDLVCAVSHETPAEVARFTAALAVAWARLEAERRGEAVLVGSGAPPELLAAAESALAKVTGAKPYVVLIETRRSTSAAYNTGFEHSSAPYVLRLDPDGAPEPDLVARLVGALDANPDAALVSAYLVDFGSPIPPECSSSEELTWASGGAAIYRRSVFAAFGGLDELFGYCEDRDYGHRVGTAGWRSLRVGGAVFRHRTRGRPSFRYVERFTESLMAWRHVHFTRTVTLKSWLVQPLIAVRANPDSRLVTLAGTLAGLLSYLRLVPACELRRRSLRTSRPPGSLSKEAPG